MVSPNDLSGMMGSMSSYAPVIMKWTGYTIMAVLIIGALWAIYFFTQFKYSVLQIVYGKMGNDEKPYIRDVKKTRARVVTENGVKKIQLLFQKMKLPVNFDFIYPRNILILFQLGKDFFLPGKIHFSDNPGAFLAPVEEDVEFWMQLNAEQTAQEYQEQGFWAKNGGTFFAMAAIVFSLILVGAVIFMTYKYIGGELGNAANAAQSLGESMRQATIQKFGGS